MPDKMPEGWTLETLYAHLSLLTLERDRRYEVQADAIERALDKAERSMNERLEGMNNIREDMRSQAATFATRADLQAIERIIDTRLKILETKNANTEGRFWAIGAVITVINVLVALVGFASHYVVK